MSKNENYFLIEGYTACLSKLSEWSAGQVDPLIGSGWVGLGRKFVDFIFVKLINRPIPFNYQHVAVRRIGLMVSVLDSEPGKPGSNLGACSG